MTQMAANGPSGHFQVLRAPSGRRDAGTAGTGSQQQSPLGGSSVSATPSSPREFTSIGHGASTTTTSTTTTTTTTTCTCPSSSQTTSSFDGVTTSDGCFCGPSDEEEEPTTDMPIMDERQIIVDEFDEEIVKKMNLLRFY